MQEISYEIQRHKESGEWVLWKIIETEYEDHGGISSKKLFNGTKKECQKKLEEIKKNDNRRTIKIRKK